VLCQRFGEDILDLLDIGSQKVLVLRHDTWYRYGDWTKRDGWWASSSKVEPKKDKTEEYEWVRDRDGSVTHRPRGNSNIRIVDHRGTQTSMYLDRNKEETEEAADSWRRRMDA